VERGISNASPTAGNSVARERSSKAHVDFHDLPEISRPELSCFSEQHVRVSRVSGGYGVILILCKWAPKFSAQVYFKLHTCATCSHGNLPIVLPCHIRTQDKKTVLVADGVCERGSAERSRSFQVLGVVDVIWPFAIFGQN
jgi:hypothetical protein